LLDLAHRDDARVVLLFGEMDAELDGAFAAPELHDVSVFELDFALGLDRATLTVAHDERSVRGPHVGEHPALAVLDDPRVIATHDLVREEERVALRPSNVEGARLQLERAAGKLSLGDENRDHSCGTSGPSF